MNEYVVMGWTAAVVIGILYSWRTVRRGRILRRNLPPGPRPWQ
jgi:hypothetical protein